MPTKGNGKARLRANHIGLMLAMACALAYPWAIAAELVKEIRIIANDSLEDVQTISIGNAFRVEIVFQQAPTANEIDVFIDTPTGCQVVMAKRESDGVFRSPLIRVIKPEPGIADNTSCVRPAPPILTVQ